LNEITTHDFVNTEPFLPLLYPAFYRNPQEKPWDGIAMSLDDGSAGSILEWNHLRRVGKQQKSHFMTNTW